MSDQGDAFAALLLDSELFESFLTKRQQVEQDYAEALAKLHSKQLEQEKKLSSGGLRNAWNEVTAALLSESHVARDSSANLARLSSTISTTNLEVKRRRKHIRESFKSSIETHESYKAAVDTLSRKYGKRVNEFIEFMVEQEETSQASGTGKEKESWPPHHWGSDSSGRGRADSNTSSSSAPTSPPPVPLHGAPRHFISGATSSGASTPAYPPAIAKPSVLGQFKSEKDKVIRLLENVGKGGEGHHHAKGGSKARQESARLKREAEEADRLYRSGIFQLETLRLNRDKMGRSESAAILEFADQMGTEIKDLLLAYTDDVHFKGQSCVAISENAKHVIEGINTAPDPSLPVRLSRTETVEPVLYMNFWYGPSIPYFGVPLLDSVPLIVERCIAEIDATGLEVEGIYRKSSTVSNLSSLVHEIERDEIAFTFDRGHDAASIAGVLKLYLRSLPHPLFPFPLKERLLFSHDFVKDSDNSLLVLSRRIKRLPYANQATLVLLCEHLARVSLRHAVNKMTASNLNLVFQHCFFGEEEENSIQAALDATNGDIVIEVMILNCAAIFEGCPTDSVARSRSGSVTVGHHLSSPPSPHSSSFSRNSSRPLSSSFSRARSPSPLGRPLSGSLVGHARSSSLKYASTNRSSPAVVQSLRDGSLADSVSLHSRADTQLSRTPSVALDRPVTPVQQNTNSIGGDHTSPPLAAAAGRRISQASEAEIEVGMEGQTRIESSVEGGKV